MGRLTIKSGNTYKYNFNTNCNFEERDERSIETHNKIVNKLGKLEDIEDELGISLIVLFKALKDGIWIKDFSEKTKHIFIDFCNASILNNHVLNYFFNCEIGFIPINRYNETWALTKEELL